jgi:hypothetical protein
VPGGSGGGIPGNGGCTGLAFWRFFSARGLGKRQLNHPARRISLRNARARLNSTRTTDHASAAPVRVEHHAQDAVDAEPRMSETGVSHAAIAPVELVSDPVVRRACFGGRLACVGDLRVFRGCPDDSDAKHYDREMFTVPIAEPKRDEYVKRDYSP